MATWLPACQTDDVEPEDLLGVMIGGRAIAVYRSPDDTWYATEGLCTHEHVLLADGLVMGNVIECPKHNGRFDYRSGEGLCAPIRENLRTFPVRVQDGTVYVDTGD